MRGFMYYWLALFIVFPFGPLLYFIVKKGREHRARQVPRCACHGLVTGACPFDSPPAKEEAK